MPKLFISDSHSDGSPHLCFQPYYLLFSSWWNLICPYKGTPFASDNHSLTKGGYQLWYIKQCIHRTQRVTCWFGDWAIWCASWCLIDGGKQCAMGDKKRDLLRSVFQSSQCETVFEVFEVSGCAISEALTTSPYSHTPGVQVTHTQLRTKSIFWHALQGSRSS